MPDILADYGMRSQAADRAIILKAKGPTESALNVLDGQAPFGVTSTEDRRVTDDSRSMP